MTLQKLLNTIGVIGVRDKLVNFTGCGGSVYELNDLSVHNYPILYCSPTGTHRVEDNYTTYQLSLFYIDRLLEDNSNGVDIHSAAVEVLKQIIRKIQKSDGVIGISDEYSINLFTETEKFKDRCNGAYANVEISVVNDTTCEDEYLDTTFKVYYHTIDGDSLGNLPSNPWGNAVVVSDVSIAPMEYTHIDGQKYIVNGYLTLTDTPTEIPLAYFRGKSNMDAIFLPDTIRKIGLGAFRYCENLTTIGGTASTDNIQVYDSSPFFGTQMSRTFVVGSKCRVIGIGLDSNMGYVEGDELKVNMTYQEFRSNVQRDCNWLSGSPIKNIRFTDITIVPELIFNDIPDVPWEGGNVNVTFDTNLIYNMRWALYRGGAVVANGTWCESQGNSIAVSVPANPDREPRDYEIVIFYKNTNEEFVRTGFTQEAKGYYLKITSYPASIDSTYQSVRFYFETDCDDTLRAFLSKSDSPDGPWSGLSTKSIDISNRSVYFNVDENSGTTKVYYKVDIVGTGTGEPEEQVSDSISFYQETDGTYFEYITYESRLVPSTATSFLVEYGTNMPTPIPYVLSSVHGTTSGVSNSNSQVIINFPENTSATDVVEYRLMMGGKSLTWYQDMRAYQINFTYYPSEITAERQLVCFVWDTDIPDDGYLAYWLGSGATREAEPVFVRSGVTHNLNGDCITFSANTGDERYYTLDIFAYLPDVAYWVAYDEIVFKQDAHTEPPVSGDTNSAITSDYVIGNPIKDIDEIVPYGYYVMRWDNEGTYGKLTRALSNEYVTDRRMSTFIDAHVDNGIIHAADAQRIRILQAIPKGDTEISGTTLYGKDSNGSEFVYTGASYLFYDIYTGKYFSWNGANGAEHLDMQVFLQYPEKSALVWNYLNASADGNRIGMRGGNIASDGSWLPFKRVLDGVDCMAGTEQRANSQYPYNYPSGWNDVKISIIPITEVQ